MKNDECEYCEYCEQPAREFSCFAVGAFLRFKPTLNLMKKIFLSFVLLAGIFVCGTSFSGGAPKPNGDSQPIQPAAQATLATQPAPASFPEIGELRQQLSAI